MMTTTTHTARRDMTAGDAAVEGLWQGLVAGVTMLAVLVLAMFLAGRSPADTLSAFAARDHTTATVGALTHLATAGVYGILWGLLWRLAGQRLRLPAWLGGLVYGLILFGVSQVTLSAVDSPLSTLPTLSFGLGHAVYGLALGLLAGRRDSKT